MFRKDLSVKLLKMIDEKNLTVTTVASLANISREYLTKVINLQHTPSIDILENLCVALETNPNDLLLSEKSKAPDKVKAAEVKQLICENGKYSSLCPSCNKPLYRDYEAYCSNCGQKLSWREFKFADITYIGDQHEKHRRKNQTCEN